MQETRSAMIVRAEHRLSRLAGGDAMAPRSRPGVV
jgi:hypothetical protein